MAVLGEARVVVAAQGEDGKLCVTCTIAAAKEVLRWEDRQVSGWAL